MCLFFMSSATTGIYPYRHTLSRRDARPICLQRRAPGADESAPAGEIGRDLRHAAGMDHAQRDLTDVGRQAGKIGLGAHDLEGAPGDLLGIAEVVVEGGGHARLLPLRTTPAISPIVMRSEEHTSELQSLMRISYAVFCLNKK